MGFKEQAQRFGEWVNRKFGIIDIEAEPDDEMKNVFEQVAQGRDYFPTQVPSLENTYALTVSEYERYLVYRTGDNEVEVQPIETTERFYSIIGENK